MNRSLLFKVGKSLCTLGFIFVLLLGCSKKNETSSSIQIDLSHLADNGQHKVGASSASEIHVVIVNVSGAGMTPIFQQWEKRSAAAVPQLTWNIDIPRGTARLIQVLVAKENQDSGLQFYYGDISQDLTTDTATIGLTVSLLGNNTSSQGAIAGRYLTGNMTGPTGNVSIKFQPPGSKPAMTVMKSAIVNGWFEFFALGDQNFTYTLEETGVNLFSGFNLLNGSTAQLYSGANSPKSMRVFVPSHYSSDSGQTTPPYVLRSSARYVLGWFGPQAATTANLGVCYEGINGSLLGLYTSSAGSTTVAWNPSADPANSGAAGVELVNGGVRGGMTEAGTPCTSGTEFTNRLKFKKTRAGRNEKLLGFVGPFKRKSSANSANEPSFITVTPASGQLNLTWDYMPGAVGTGHVGGVKIYTRTNAVANAETNYESGGGINCADLVSGYGFALQSTVAQPTLTTNIGNTQMVSDWQAGKVQIVLCPYLESNPSKMLNAAVSTQFYGGGSTSLPLATKLVFKGPLGETGLTVGAPLSVMDEVCTPLDIVGQTATGQLAQFPANATITFATSTGTTNVYSDPECSQVIDNTSHPSGFLVGNPNQHRVYALSTVNGAVTVGGTATAGLTVQTLYINVITAQTANYVRILAPSVLKSFQCVPAYVQLHYGATGPVADLASPLAFNFMSVTDLEIYDDIYPNCTGGSPISGITLGDTYGSSKIVYIYYKGLTAPANFNLAFDTPPVTSQMGGTYSTSNGTLIIPGPVASLVLESPSHMPIDSCHPLKVSLVDSAGNPAPNPGSTINVTLSSAGIAGQFFPSPGCVSAGTSTGNLSISEDEPRSTGTVYFNPTQTGDLTLSATSTAPVLSIDQNVTVEVSSSPTRFKYKLPGQTVSIASNGLVTIAGTATPRVVGTSFGVVAYAVTPNGYLAQEFNASATLGTVPPELNVNTNPVTFANGIANITLTYTQSQTNAVVSLIDTSLGVNTADSSAFNVVRAPTPAKLKIWGMMSPQTSQGNCAALFITLQDNFGNTAPAQANTVVTALDDSADGDFYSEDTCTTSATTVNIPTGQHLGFIYYKATTAAARNFSFTASGLTSVTGLSYTPSTPYSPSAVSEIWTFGEPVSNSGTCQAFVALLTDANQIPVNNGSALSLSTQPALAPGDMAMYADPSCTSSVSTIDFSASEKFKIFYILIRPGYSINDMPLSATDGGGGMTESGDLSAWDINP